MHPFRLAWRALEELGPTSLTQYLQYQVQLRSGWLKARTPIRRWCQGEINTALTNDADAIRPEAHAFWSPPEGVSESDVDWRAAFDRIRGGTFPIFGREIELGTPPDWRAYPPLIGVTSGLELGRERHWSAYDLREFPVDVKLLWEPSRFGWALTLARAYECTGDLDCPREFERLLLSWLEANRLNSGPHWISAQEVALRGLAAIYCRYAFEGWLASSRKTGLGLIELIAGSASRVSRSLPYARAQNNNHLLSEAAFLYTAGSLFPGLEGSGGWKRLGRRELINGFESQVEDSGAYIQQSVNYHRLAIELGLWSLRVAEVCGDNQLDQLRGPLQSMLTYLQAISDPLKGRAPNIGPNDGSLLFPRPGVAFGDMRPTVQAASTILNGEPAYERGRWDFLARFLGVQPNRGSGSGHPVRSPLTLTNAGVEIIRTQEATGFLRCARFRARPGHADQLHFSLIWRGLPLLLDPGTYLYSGDQPWDNALRTAHVHNTVTVNGLDQMSSAGRFLYLDWAQGTVGGRWESAGLAAAVCRHNGYRAVGVTHQRTVVTVDGRSWLIVDDLLGSGPLEAELAWLLPDVEWAIQDSRLRLETSKGPAFLHVSAPACEDRLVRAGETIHGAEAAQPPIYGWYSATYAELQPALHWRTRVAGQAPMRVITRLELGEGVGNQVEVTYRPPAQDRAAVERVLAGQHELRL